MKKFLLSASAAILLITSGIASSGHVSAESLNDIRDKINKFDKEQREINEKQGNINKDKSSTEGKIDENLNKQSTVKSEIETIDEKLTNTKAAIQTKENEITETNNEIDDLKTQIENLKEEIIDLQERIKKREALLKNRLRAIQKSGGSMKYIEVILGSKSFGDFISRSSAVNTIMDQDKNIMEIHEADKLALEEKKVEVESKKEEVEKKKASLENQKQELVALKGQLDEQMAEREKLMAQLEEEHEHLEEYKMSLEEETKVLNDQAAIIAQAKKSAKQQESKKLEQLAEEKRKREAAAAASKKSSSGSGSSGSSASSANLSAGGSGVLNWPASGRFTSGYGYRSFNGGGIHYGIDIAAGQGTPVYASASGVVTRASYSPSYGNVVYIYHPDLNLTTVYAHLHSMSVSYGAQVSSGQLVGGIGNTGGSFGNHLHFEVHNGPWSHKGGVNPMQYLK